MAASCKAWSWGHVSVDPDYIVGLANWTNAFAVVIVEPNGHTAAQVCPIIDGDPL
jgi:hypothetical protein